MNESPLDCSRMYREAMNFYKAYLGVELNFQTLNIVYIY